MSLPEVNPQLIRNFRKKSFLERCVGTSGDVGGVSSSFLVMPDARLSVSSLESRRLDMEGRTLDMEGLACLMLSLSPILVLTRDVTL